MSSVVRLTKVTKRYRGQLALEDGHQEVAASAGGLKKPRVDAFGLALD